MVIAGFHKKSKSDQSLTIMIIIIIIIIIKSRKVLTKISSFVNTTTELREKSTT